MRKNSAAARLSLSLALAAASAFPVAAQNSGSSRQSGANTNQSSGASSAGNASAVTTGQTQLYNATGTNGAAVTQDTFKGSLISKAKNTGLVLDLDPRRRHRARICGTNLGIILGSSNAPRQNADGQRLELLQQLLPTVTASSTYHRRAGQPRRLRPKISRHQPHHRARSRSSISAPTLPRTCVNIAAPFSPTSPVQTQLRLRQNSPQQTPATSSSSP